uniref:hypothetical protein n=1 Tax=Sphaerisporangium sp. CA-236357 TaxID=3240030 RepID=UPI003F491E44
MNIVNGKRMDDGDDITGDIGVVISGNNGTVHLGNGDVYNTSVVIEGDGFTYVAGDNPTGVSKNCETSAAAEVSQFTAPSPLLT